MYTSKEGAARILLVADDAGTRKLYTQVLGADRSWEQIARSLVEIELFATSEVDPPNFELCLSCQGDEAVEAASQSVSKRSPFEVAFIDMRVPPGTDGTQMAERLWEIDPDIKVVMITECSDIPTNKIAGRVLPSDNLLFRQKPLPASEIFQLAWGLSEKWRTHQHSQMLIDSVEQNSASVLIADIAGNIEYVNTKFSASTRYDPDDVVGRNMRMLRSTHNSESVYADIRETLAAGGVWHGDLCNEKKNGEPFWEYMRISPFTSGTGKSRHFVFLMEDVAGRRDMEKELEYQANYDEVTGLPNRMLMLDRLCEAAKRAHRKGDLVGVLIVDIDDFEKVGTSLGQTAADRLLADVAKRMGASIRQTDTLLRIGADTVGRISGDTFIVIVPDIKVAADAQLVAERILRALEIPFTLEGQEVLLTASSGITLYPIDGEDPEILIRNASAAVQRSKEGGSNSFSFLTPELNTKAKERLAMEARLRQALLEDDIHVMFQPIVASENGHIVGAEALVRCGDGSGGFIPPDKFIPLAERSGIINDLGRRVLDIACREVRNWHDRGHGSLHVAVNVSPRQFYSGDLTEIITRILDRYQLPWAALHLEITEGLLLDDSPAVNEVLGALCERGVRLSIDDFGTGYSSLRSLRRFPLDVLKIDRSFVSGLSSNREDIVLVESIINMAHSLRYQVVAEGIETVEQEIFLVERGCDFLQGYRYSKPIPSKDFEHIVKKQCCSGPIVGDFARDERKPFVILDSVKN